MDEKIYSKIVSNKNSVHQQELQKKQTNKKPRSSLFLFILKYYKTAILQTLLEFKIVVFYFNIFSILIYSSGACHYSILCSFWYANLVFKKHVPLLINGWSQETSEHLPIYYSFKKPYTCIYWHVWST